MPLSLHLFGYGPEFFQYLFPLIHPREIRHLNIGPGYYGVTEAHNNILNRWVELGFFGLASYLVLSGALALIGIRVILNKRTPAQVRQRLVMPAAVAAVAGRTVEQLAGIPHISDEALFWTLLALVAALPKLVHEQIRGETSSRRVESPLGAIQVTSPIGRARVLQVSLALVIAGLVLAFTWVRNPNYALAESKAASAAAYLVDDQPNRAMQSIDGAIALAPDVGRYRVIRANILDQARLALEAYRANRRAVAVNRFDIYGRLHFAESALTLAILGHPGKGKEAINGFQSLTFLQPRFWLAHFLLGRAYQEMGEPDRAVEAYSEDIRIDPLNALLFDRRAEAYEILGKRGLALDDHDTAVVLSPNDSSYHVRRGIALFSMGRLDEAIQDLDQAINSYEESINYEVVSRRNLDEAGKFEPRLARAYNNRGSAYYQLGRIERAIEDYDRAIQLSPELAEFYANRAYAYELLSKDSEARRDFERATSLGFKPLSLDQT